MNYQPPTPESESGSPPAFAPDLWRKSRYRRRSHPTVAQLKRRASRKTSRGATATQLPEWHALDQEQRADSWHELVDWVGWLYQRYELSVEERLPHCWAEHPGLIEELRALKAWREEIYTSPQPNGQAARYWHVEMRQLVTNATAFYASGCRAGHRGPELSHDQLRRLRRSWAEGNPSAGIPASLLAGVADDGLHMPSDAMKAAIATGEAQPLSATMHDFVRYDGSWWRTDGTGWIRVTDTQLSAQFDTSAARMAAADAAVARRHGYAFNRPDVES